MTVKECVDVFQGYYEPIDWLSNGVGFYLGLKLKAWLFGVVT